MLLPFIETVIPKIFFIKILQIKGTMILNQNNILVIIIYCSILFLRLLSQLFYILYKMIALKQIGSFQNCTNPHQPTISLQKSTLSPQGNYLLRYDPSNSFQRLYNLQEQSVKKITICPRNKCIIIKPQFTNDERFIFYTDSKEIGMFQRQTQMTVNIVPFDQEYNQITDIKLSYNNSLLYYVNKTTLYVLDIATSQILPIINEQNECSASKMALSPNQNQLITSSLKQGLRICIVCSWQLKNSTFKPTSITTLSNCLINQMRIIDNMVVISNRINNNWLNSYILDINTLSTLTMTKMVNQISAGFVVEYHNYRLEYFSRFKTGYLYRNNFTIAPIQISTKVPLTIKYDKFKDAFYIMQLENSINILKKYVAVFNCFNITNSTKYINNSYATDCECPQGHKFNKSSLKCQLYDAKKGQMLCNPLKGQTFNTFNLKCQLNCSIINNTVPISAYGNPLKCLCNQPNIWNKLQSNCNFIDCSLISNAIIGFGKTCQCIKGYVWRNISQICQQKSIPKSNNTHSIVQTQQSSSSTGLIVSIILILIALIAAIIYYYKKCRSEPSQDDDNKPNQDRQTDRKINEFQMGGIPNNVESNQHLDKKPSLKESNQQQDKRHSFRIQHQQPQENIDNFSIGDDEFQQKIEDELSAIQSNIQNPLA